MEQSISQGVYYMYMGLIGMIITVLIMVLGMGYYFFGMSQSQSSITIDNQPAHILPSAENVSGRQSTDSGQQETINNQSARDVKNLVEQKSAETAKIADETTKNISPVTDTKKNEASPSGADIVDRLMSAGFSVPTKARSIDTVVIHSSYDLNGSDPYSTSGIIKEYTDYGVSAHYLIDRKGVIYRLVEDKNIAYHAGVSKMPDGRKNVNDFSIGIEMMNTEKGQFTSAQYRAVNDLIASLKKQYKIKFVVGHNDIAPDRKTDPWNFDWKKVS